MARERTDLGANLLINLTNDAWYGRSSAPVQQLAFVVLRAVENRRSLARAANTGISCFVDPLGRLQATSPMFEKLYMTAKLSVLKEKSFYTRYGFYFPHLCLLALSLFLVYIRFQLKNETEN